MIGLPQLNKCNVLINSALCNEQSLAGSLQSMNQVKQKNKVKLESEVDGFNLLVEVNPEKYVLGILFF